VPSRNATLALYVGGFMGPFGGAVLGVLVPELQETFHASRDAVAAAIPAYLIPFAALQLISGTVGERLGVTRVIRTGFIVYAIGSLIAAFAPTLNVFIAARFVQGGSNAFLTPLLLATLAEIVPPQLLTRAMGTFASVQTGALSLAPLIGGLLAVVNWRLAFLLSACVGVALAIFTARTSGSAPPRRRDRPSMRSLITRRLGFLCGCAFLGYATVAGVGYMVSFYARDEMGLGPLQRGLVLACFGAAGFVLGRPLGSAVQIIGRVPAVIIGALFSALCVAPLGITVTPWQLAALWTLAGAGSVLLWTGLNTLAVEAVPENRGGATSMFGAFRFAGSALSPYVFLPIYNVAPEHAFFACAVAACAIVPLAVAIRTLTPEPAVRPYPATP
jgi:MFS family permease